MKRIMPPMAVEFMQDIKKSVDPKNIFAINNTVFRSEQEEADALKGHDF
jgi:hypothetical protein